MSQSILYADLLNRECRCQTLCEKSLNQKVEGIGQERPNLFAKTTTFLGLTDFKRIREFIVLVEKIIHNPHFQEKTLGHLLSSQSPHGVFMGYDFHLTEKGPRLIEINTNAGGAFLNLILARSQESCCEEMNLFFEDSHKLEELHHIFMNMFREEWKIKRGDIELKTIAIIDDHPKDQYLSPEFILFQELFEEHGHKAFILDPSQVKEKADGLYFENTKIDLIYNRLTDFSLSQENHQHLYTNWKRDKVVLTPNPEHHLLYAHKKNLTLLSDDHFLKTLPLTDAERESLLKMIPPTKLVRGCDNENLWKDRKNLFFKPVDGFGSKATYRGDKITQRVWGEILKGDYVAQGLIPPSHRVIKDKEAPLKVDIRAYTYKGKILIMAARLYEGQTTNFRTAGGGFSPVFVVAGKET